jgi:hypothetical protein
VDRGVLLAEARANGLVLGVELDLDPLERVSDEVLQLMTETTCKKGFEDILRYPTTREAEAEWILK